jgi:hypothetical protein
MKRTIYLLLGVSTLAISGWGGEHEVEDDAPEHNSHKHHVAVFLGNTHDHHGNNAFTVGVDYEYRLTDLFGTGGVIDHAGGDINATVIAGGLFTHPWKGLRLATLLGNEHQTGHNEFLVRLGMSYDFHIKKWILTPIIDVDLLESGHQNWVYGIAVGRAF